MCMETVILHEYKLWEIRHYALRNIPEFERQLTEAPLDLSIGYRLDQRTFQVPFLKQKILSP